MLTKSTIIPNEKQAISISEIAKTLQARSKAKFSLLCPDGIKIPLPEPLTRVLLIAAEALKSKTAVTVLVRHSWITTQEAADIMGYSRQVVVDLIKKSELKASQLGNHRRIKLTDLMEFIECQGRSKARTIAGLVTEATKNGSRNEECHGRSRKKK